MYKERAIEWCKDRGDAMKFEKVEKSRESPIDDMVMEENEECETRGAIEQKNNNRRKSKPLDTKARIHSDGHKVNTRVCRIQWRIRGYQERGNKAAIDVH